METKLVMWTCVAMAVMLSIVYFSLSFIASVVHQIRERRQYMTEKQYSEYGYRGLEEIKAKDKEIKKLKKEISDLKTQLQLQENQTNKYSAIAHLPNY